MSNNPQQSLRVRRLRFALPLPSGRGHASQHRSPMITAKNTGPVRIVRLDYGKVNALDLEVVRALARELRELGTSRGIVLTGADRVFSAGVDLCSFRR